MLGWRLFLGPVLILVLLALFIADAWAGATAPILWGLACLITLRSTWELTQLLRVRFEPNFPLLACAAVAVVSANWIAPLASPATLNSGFAARSGPPMLAYSLAVIALFVSGMARYRAPGKTIENLGAELLTLSYVAVLVSLIVQLRWIDA